MLTQLRWALSHLDQVRALATTLRPAVTRFDWAEMGSRYDEAMAPLATAARSAPVVPAHRRQ
ncbi:MAG: hypothetical protein V3S14_07575 [Anaerolineae bacterium]